MTGLEILFITSVIMLLVMWTWFVILGFRTSRLWGASLILLFPLSPFLFAYRFERKTRQIISYFTGSLVFFIAILLYIHFGTIDFFPRLSHKIAKRLPSMDFSTKPKDVKKLNLPPPTFIPPKLEETPEDPTTKPEEPKTVPETAVQTRKFRAVDVGSAGNYVGKTVLITTSSGAQHKGKLTSAATAQVEVKINISGGTALITVKKSKIVKFEVYI